MADSFDEGQKKLFLELMAQYIYHARNEGAIAWAVYGIAAALMVSAGIAYPDWIALAALVVGLVGYDFWRRLLKRR